MRNISKIDTILFDLGGVLFHIDYTAPVKAFAALGMPNFDNMFSKAMQNNLIDLYETGQLTSSEFIQIIREIAKIDLPEASVERAWNAILLGMPPQFVGMLYQLAANYKLILLSNTNDLHLKKLRDIMQLDLDGFILENVFDAVFYSHELGLRKPNREAFEAIIEQAKFDPHKTLYIEDSPQHIATAKQLGFYTIHHPTNSTNFKALTAFIPQLRI